MIIYKDDKMILTTTPIPLIKQLISLKVIQLMVLVYLLPLNQILIKVKSFKVIRIQDLLITLVHIMMEQVFQMMTPPNKQIIMRIK